MGTASRNLKEHCTAKGESIGGTGKLVNDLNTKIQNYYRHAIKDNHADIMKHKISAIVFYLTSTDMTPRHVHCPPGEKSWCFWKKTEVKKEKLGPHKDYETVPNEIRKKTVPIF